MHICTEYILRLQQTVNHSCTYIYSKRSKPCARIEHWVLRLQPQTDSEDHGRNIAEDYVRFIAEIATPKALKTRDIERESAKDECLETLRECIRGGNWDSCPPEFKYVYNELCVVGKLVLRGCRIVIPTSLRTQVVKLAHEGHQGIVKTKLRLQTKVWWPGINRDAEKICRHCHGCQLVAQPTNPEPMKCFEMPTCPWLDTAADLLGPMPDGEYILAVVDYYSCYFEVAMVKSVTTETVIQCMNQMFAYGYPLSLLKTDNGRQFVSKEFESYLDENGIEHRLSPPFWPQENGEIERQNRTMLKSMKIAHAEGKDWKVELYRALLLLAYRTTPHMTTGATPAKLMFGRELRTKLPELQETTFFFFLNCFYSWNTGFGIAGLPPQPTSRYIPQYAAVV